MLRCWRGGKAGRFTWPEFCLNRDKRGKGRGGGKITT